MPVKHVEDRERLVQFQSWQNVKWCIDSVINLKYVWSAFLTFHCTILCNAVFYFLLHLYVVTVTSLSRIKTEPMEELDIKENIWFVVVCRKQNLPSSASRRKFFGLNGDVWNYHDSELAFHCKIGYCVCAAVTNLLPVIFNEIIKHIRTHICGSMLMLL